MISTIKFPLTIDMFTPSHLISRFSSLKIPLCILPLVFLAFLAASWQLSHPSTLHANSQQGQAESCQSNQPLNCPLQQTDQLSQILESITLPTFTPPAPEIVAPPTTTRKSDPVTVYYTVSSRGVIQSNLKEFQTQAQQTLTDPRGWSQLGINFKPVASGGQFSLILASAEQLPQFSSGCSSLYSCRVGTSVIINQDRWNQATDSWNAAGGSLRDYRHMVINHEVGHWLGHQHRNCPKAGAPAPLMQQQSINLQGCTFNPWPTSSELSAPNLGIY